LRTSIARLLQLEASATDTTNLIAIETAISDRQGELESLEAQQRGLDDQISMSTITLILRSDAAAPPIKPADFWSGLGAGWGAFVAFWAGTLVILGVLLPWLVFLGAAAVITVFVVRLVRRRAARAATPVAHE
jgi:Flp pilus assembly protein TadB